MFGGSGENSTNAAGEADGAETITRVNFCEFAANTYVTFGGPHWVQINELLEETKAGNTLDGHM